MLHLSRRHFDWLFVCWHVIGRFSAAGPTWLGRGGYKRNPFCCCRMKLFIIKGCRANIITVCLFRERQVKSVWLLVDFNPYCTLLFASCLSCSARIILCQIFMLQLQTWTSDIGGFWSLMKHQTPLSFYSCWNCFDAPFDLNECHVLLFMEINIKMDWALIFG